MDIETLLKVHSDYQEPINVSIGIAFTETDVEKWRALNIRLERIDRRLKLAMFARKKIILMMAEIELWVEEHEKMVQAQESSVNLGPEANA